VKVKLTPPANAPVTAYQVSVVGAAKHGGRDWSVRSAPSPMVLMKK